LVIITLQIAYLPTRFPALAADVRQRVLTEARATRWPFWSWRRC
jgi:hypothetical protein